jgi:hypothetical protein
VCPERTIRSLPTSARQVCHEKLLSRRSGLYSGVRHHQVSDRRIDVRTSAEAREQPGLVRKSVKMADGRESTSKPSPRHRTRWQQVGQGR